MHENLKVLIATDDVMEWMETVLMEKEKIGSHFDMSWSRISMDFERVKVKTTRSTAELFKVFCTAHICKKNVVLNFPLHVFRQPLVLNPSGPIKVDSQIL